MTDMIVPILFAHLMLFSVITIYTSDIWFNIKYNYEKWYEINWFGVILFTVLYWIACLPIALIWLFIKSITIGRK